MGAMETLLARIGATQNPGHLVAQGVNKITTPGYPADDALRGYVAGAPAFQPTLGGMLKQTGTDLAAQTDGFLRSLMAGDYEAVMNSSLFPLGAMTVYHGSPHKFDAFDLSKIGTGEGAQAYGHGLYFAENPGVAKNYQALGEDFVELNGKTIAPTLTRNSYADGATEVERLAANAFWRFKNTKEAAEFLTNGYHSEAEAAAAKLLKSSKNVGIKAGNFYHVDIPDDEIAKMLDWDKPLSEQPESVKSLLRGSEIAPDESVWSQYTGQQLYEGEMQAGGPYKGSGWAGSEAQKAVSEKLRKIGIPGIKYLDGSSRRAGEGTRNLVLFDDKLAKVLKRE